LYCINADIDVKYFDPKNKKTLKKRIFMKKMKKPLKTLNKKRC